MSFDDLRYPVFLALVIVAITLAPLGRARMSILICASVFFYVVLEDFWPILPLVALTSYLGGLVLSRTAEGSWRSAEFVAILVTTVSPLIFFKYVPAALSSAADKEPWTTWRQLVLPVGLSFYTFMALGYLVDVFTRTIEAERDPIRYFTFVSFFPHLTAGPIERAGKFLPQLDQLGVFNGRLAISGLRAFLLGAFMKIALADTLAPTVNAVYSNPSQFGATDLTLATAYFSFQVYGDFAGYSLMAIGSGRLLGIELMRNFEQPYLSQTLPEYWRRWHISLSSWFRDYVFIPLQFSMRRAGRSGLAIALIFTFTLVGAWHGAGSKYVIFGLVHGILVAYSTLTITKRNKVWKKTGAPKIVQHAFRSFVTFIIISLTFILFRAADAKTAMFIYERLIDGQFAKPSIPLRYPFLAILMLVAGDLVVSKGITWDVLKRPVRWVLYYAIALILAWVAVPRALADAGYEQGFIYFGF